MRIKSCKSWRRVECICVHRPTTKTFYYQSSWLKPTYSPAQASAKDNKEFQTLHFHFVKIFSGTKTSGDVGTHQNVKIVELLAKLRSFATFIHKNV